MKNIIFSDVDGTIYDSSHKVMNDTIKDINRAKELNVEFVIATGNGYFNKMETLAKELDIRYVITSNGASIFDTKKNDFIYKSTVPKDAINKLLIFANEHQIPAAFWDWNNVYINQWTPKEMQKLIQKAMISNDKLPIKEQVENDMFKIEFYDEPKKIDKLVTYLKTLNFQYARMKPTHIEITHEGVSKGSAIKWLCSKLNIDLSNTMGIGDSPNDFSMFEVVNSSYAMDNAPEEVKAKTKYYTCDVTQNGLGYAIIDYLHREKLDRGK